MDLRNKFVLKIVLDIFCLLTVGLLLLCLWLFAQPFKRGFFCDDLSIRYPYNDNTVDTYALASLVLIPIIVTICGVETYRYKNKQHTTKLYKPFWRELYDKFIPFLFGILTSLLCTYVSKVCVGRLRPYFYTICKPNVDCNETNKYQYIEDFECSGSDVAPEGAVDEMRMSFMSGHSSLMAFSMVYLALYLQKRWPISRTYGSLLRGLLQGLAMNLAFFVGYTRISDYWHHWSDVLMGLLQGSVAAILTVRCLSDLSDNKSSIIDLFNTSDYSLETDTSSDRKATDFQIRLIKQTSI